jgi:hypothetical protein
MDELLMTIFAALRMIDDLVPSYPKEAASLNEAKQLLQRAFSIIRDSGARDGRPPKPCPSPR